MKLEAYLKELRTCPNEKLEDEFGIHDNLPIFLRIEFEKLVQYFVQADKYKHICKSKKEGGIEHRFSYLGGIVDVFVVNWIGDAFVTGGDEDIQKQLRDYNTTVVLCNTGTIRDLANVVNQLGQFAIDEPVPLCLPHSLGKKGIRTKDYSKIVYFPN